MARSATGGSRRPGGLQLSGAPDAGGLVPAVGLFVRPGAARRAVTALDVGEAPADLGSRVGLPVGAGARHQRARQRLRDAVRAGTRVLGGDVPAALALPERLEARELAARPAEMAEHLLGDL